MAVHGTTVASGDVTADFHGDELLALSGTVV